MKGHENDEGTGAPQQKERLKELKLLSLETRRLRSISSMFINIRMEGAKKMEPGSFLRYLVTRSEAMGSNWNTVSCL